MKFEMLVMPDKNDLKKEQEKLVKELAREVRLYKDIPKTEKEIIKRIGEADAILTSWIDINKKIIDSCPKLKYIGVMATGYGWIDVKVAAEKGITVTNVPHYSTESVAELIMGNLVALFRNSFKADSFVRNGKGKKEQLLGEELKGKTIGIIGLGEIGGRLAELASAFGMNVLYYSRTKKDFPYKFCSLEELLKESDIVSINCSLSKETEKVIGEKEFALMRKGSVLVNFVHGKTVDEKAMLKHLKSGKIRAVIDDIQDEKVKKELAKLRGDIILSPHIGYYTKNAIENLANIAIQNAKSFLEEKVENKVN